MKKTENQKFAFIKLLLLGFLLLAVIPFGISKTFYSYRYNSIKIEEVSDVSQVNLNREIGEDKYFKMKVESFTPCDCAEYEYGVLQDAGYVESADGVGFIVRISKDIKEQDLPEDKNQVARKALGVGKDTFLVFKIGKSKLVDYYFDYELQEKFAQNGKNYDLPIVDYIDFEAYKDEKAFDYGGASFAVAFVVGMIPFVFYLVNVYEKSKQKLEPII